VDFKGFVLSAGYGTRLRPITDKIPKALVRLGSKTLLDYGVDFLKKFGIEKIGINAHYKADLLEKEAKKRNLLCFKEKEILGTGGYLKNLGGFFDFPLIAVNCDTLFFKDENILGRLVSEHIKSKNIITLVLKKLDGQSFTSIKCEKGKVLSIGEGSFFFTGLQIISPEVEDFVEFSIVDVYKKLIPLKKLGCVEFKGDWFDCGTLKGLIDANFYVFGENENVFYENASVSREISVKKSVIYPSKIDGNGSLVDCVVYENAFLTLKGETFQGKIFV